LDKRISFRKRLLKNFDAELAVIQSDIRKKSVEIKKLEEELNMLKEGYAEMLRSSQKQVETGNNWWFILSSQNIGQAYKRYYYLKQYSNYRRLQGENLALKKEDLLEAKARLIHQKKEKENLKGEKLKEKKELESEKREFRIQLEALKSMEKGLLADLAVKEKEANELQKAIREAIRKELEANKPKTEATADAKAYVLTPEEKLISKNFKGNKGKLPWPVRNGEIVSHYGKHRHPYLPNITIENNGIEIETSKGQSVRAVYRGKVSSIIILPSGLKVVILKHGEYSSIYSNLSEVYVKDGDKVSTKEKIGKVHVTSNDLGKFQFQIWKGTNGENPESWLSK
jgi:septal ring factor EnvC (AmiA/AmiB activator)